MARILVIMRSGEKREFPDGMRPGGSWATSCRYEPGFVVVTDEWENQTAIPSTDIEEIKTFAQNRGR